MQAAVGLAQLEQAIFLLKKLKFKKNLHLSLKVLKKYLFQKKIIKLNTLIG